MNASSSLDSFVSLMVTPLYVAHRRKEQWLTPAALVRLRSRRLRELLQKARAASYYRRVLPNIPADGPEGRLLAGVALLDKRILVDEGLDAFLTAGSDGLFDVVTSGSTGHPGKFLRSPLEETEYSARMYRTYTAYGCTMHDRIFNVGSTTVHRRSGAATALRDMGVLPKVRSVFVGTPVEESVRILREFKPHLLTGYAVGLERIAEYLVRHDIEVERPKAVACGAMEVTDYCRDVLQKAFRAPAMDMYVANEFGVIAWECPERRGSLHINDDVFVMEIADDDGQPAPDGSIGEVVLTSLTLKRMPLIRYRTGDTAARIPESCACGRGLGLMTRIQGRTAHTIVAPDGRLFTGPTIGSIFKAARAYEWVRRFQVRECEGNVLLVLVESHHEPTETQTRTLLGEMSKVFGPDYSFKLEILDEIPLAPSGKHQSLVPLTRRET